MCVVVGGEEVGAGPRAEKDAGPRQVGRQVGLEGERGMKEGRSQGERGGGLG